MIDKQNFLKDFKLVWKVMDPSDRRKFVKSIFVNLVIAVLELIGVSSLIPFLGLLAEGEKALQHPAVQPLKLFWPTITHDQLILVGGGSVVGLLLLTNISLYLGNVFALRTSSEIIHSLSSKLYNYFLHSPYSYHVKSGSTLLATKIGLVGNLANNFLSSIVNVLARSTLAILIISTLFLVNPIATGSAIAFFAVCYFALYRNVKSKVSDFGFKYKVAMKKRNKIITESLRGIKDVIVCRYQPIYNQEFNISGKEMWFFTAEKQRLSIFPRYLLEAAAFGGMTLFAMFLSLSGSEFKNLIPELTLFTVLGYKLLPAGQTLYVNLLAIASQTSTFDELREDLVSLVSYKSAEIDFTSGNIKSINVDNVSFSYAVDSKPVLTDVSFRINSGSIMGIVGSSGSGKTTLLDLLLGLYKPDSGEIVIEGDMKTSKLFDYSSYVPQSVYIRNATLQDNITMDGKAIDHDRLKSALYVSCLDSVVEDLPDGLQTILHEDGARFSGGQKQRVGIARAIYRNSPLLVLDEATSALDKHTESLVLNRIKSLNKTTIVVTHKLSSLRDCDEIIILNRGALEDKGSFDSLMSRSEMFKLLADSH